MFRGSLLALPPAVEIAKQLEGSVVHHCQGPAPAGEFSRDGDVRDRGSFASFDEPDPPVVEAPVPEVTAGTSCGGGLFPTPVHDSADVIARTMMPGGFDEQPTGMAVAGLGDGPLHPGLPGRELTGHESDERSDAVAGEPVPVADLHGQSKRRQRAHSTQTPEPAHDRGELAVGGELLDRVLLS